MKRSMITTALAAAALVCVAEPALAQTSRSTLGGTNWRQRDRRAARSEKGLAQRFAFELRFGPYYPAIDDEFGGAGPYQQVFGNSGKFSFGFEFDWQALRIPWVGTIGPGVGWTFMSTSAHAFKLGTTDRSTVDTSLTIMPMHVSAVLRLDELFRRTGVPVVPYGKVGFGMATWSTSIQDETSKVKVSGREVLGRGLSFGLHWAVGGMLALDWLSPRSMATLDAETGINHIYVFGEWLNYDLGTFSDSQMQVGTSTWTVGMAMEM
jgi:hypothetical protein